MVKTLFGVQNVLYILGNVNSKSSGGGGDIFLKQALKNTQFTEIYFAANSGSFVARAISGSSRKLEKKSC